MQHVSRKALKLGELRTIDSKDDNVSLSVKKVGLKKVPDSLHEVFYDVFMYKNKTYFDLWWRHHPSFESMPDYKVGRLKIFLSDN